jgi:hypothetical protein
MNRATTALMFVACALLIACDVLLLVHVMGVRP